MLLRLIRHIKNNRPWWWPTEDKREFCGEQIVVREQVYTCWEEINHGYGHVSATGFRWAA